MLSLCGLSDLLCSALTHPVRVVVKPGEVAVKRYAIREVNKEAVGILTLREDTVIQCGLLTLREDTVIQCGLLALGEDTVIQCVRERDCIGAVKEEIRDFFFMIVYF